MQICKKCSMELPEDYFPVLADSGKRRTSCNSCLKEYRLLWRAGLNQPRHIQTKEERAAKMRSYLATDKGKQAKRRGGGAWIERNKEKRLAQNKLNNAQRYDPSLNPKPCVRCGSSKTHAHHEDYTRPLDVIWLCPAHHAERHRELRQQA